MRRLTGQLPDLALLRSLDHATSPPGSTPSAGPLLIHEAAHGVVVEVSSRSLDNPTIADRDLRELLTRGTAGFPTAHHWFQLCAGPLAAAFAAPPFTFGPGQFRATRYRSSASPA